MTFRELCERWCQYRANKRSLEQDKSRLRTHLLPFFGKFRLTEIKESHIERFKTEKLAKLNTETVRRNLTPHRNVEPRSSAWMDRQKVRDR